MNFRQDFFCTFDKVLYLSALFNQPMSFSEMKEISLGRDMFALVDDADYPELSKYKWYALRHRTGKVYAIGRVNERMVLMHRLIMGAKAFSEKVDHADRDSLNNTRQNLRLSTNSENMMNRGAAAHNKTGFKGVLKRTDKRTNKYKAQIGVNGKTIYLGHFDTAKEAAHAYNEKAKELHGEFASLNKI